jgi:hypothetical protein
VIKDRLFVHQEPVVTAVQLVDLGQPGILAQQIGQGTALKPPCVSLISPRYSTCRCTTRPLAVRVFSTTLQ